MLGYIRLFKKENCIIETKQTGVKFRDLRLHDPWPELQAFSDSFEMEKLPIEEYNHVPYAVILIKVLQKWNASHNNVLPKTFKEKDEFKQGIRDLEHKQ